MPFLLFLGTLRAKIAVGAALFLALVSWRAYDIHNQRAIGAEKVVAKIEKATNEKISKATAARRSVDSIPDGGMFDAYRRD